MTNVHAATLAQHPTFRLGLRPVAPLHLIVLAVKAYRVNRQRRQLAELTDSQLADIGITREQALAESTRSFWDLPREQP